MEFWTGYNIRILIPTSQQYNSVDFLKKKATLNGFDIFYEYLYAALIPVQYGNQ